MDFTSESTIFIKNLIIKILNFNDKEPIDFNLNFFQLGFDSLQLMEFETKVII